LKIVQIAYMILNQIKYISNQNTVI